MGGERKINRIFHRQWCKQDLQLFPFFRFVRAFNVFLLRCVKSTCRAKVEVEFDNVCLVIQ